MFFRAIAIILLLTSCAAEAAPKEADIKIGTKQESFDDWLDKFAQKALAKGISQKTIDDALGDATLSKKAVVLDRKQPEKKLTMDEYLDNVINDDRIAKGKQMMLENRAVLQDISARTGVEPQFIVALWGLESGYGENQGNFKVVDALATLAYEGRRRDFFESELLGALLIIEQQHIKSDDLRGSWAGAMGQCQFMPSSYLAYAVDYDGDHKIDIWHSKEDTMASIANYLSTVGWGKTDEQKQKVLMDWNRSKYFVASVFELAEAIK